MGKTYSSYYTTRYNSNIAFRGIDESTPKFQASTSRAIDMLNYTWRDNCVQKRFGTKPSFEDIGTTYYFEKTSNLLEQKSSTPIYDMWWLNETLIIHKGVLLFKWEIGEDKPSLITIDDTTRSKTIDNVTHTYEHTICVPDKHFGAITHKNTLWLFTGNGYYKYTNGKLSLVQDSKDTYVPTTTIGITSNGSGLGARTTLESANMLTRKKKNKLVGVPKDNSYPLSYTLDSKIDSGHLDETSITIETTIPRPKAMEVYDTGVSLIDEWDDYYIVFPNIKETIYIPVWGKEAVINSKAFPLVGYVSSDGNLIETIDYISYTYTDPQFVDEDHNQFFIKEDGVVKLNSSMFNSGMTVSHKLYIKLTGKNGNYTYIETNIYFVDISKIAVNVGTFVNDFNVGDRLCEKGYFNTFGLASSYPLWTWFVSVFNCPDGYSPLRFITDKLSLPISLNSGISTNVFDSILGTLEIVPNKANEVTRTITLTGADFIQNMQYPYDRENYPSIWGMLVEPSTGITYGTCVEDTIYFFENFVSPVDGESNIEVEFDSESGYEPEKINKCTFGILFGASNLKNRLFLSGNEDYPNYDWHSGEDLSYFYVDTDTPMAYGTTSNSVCGYSIISDGTLLVLKTPSDTEPTIYYRRTATSSVTDDSGSTENYVSGTPTKTIFPLTTTNAKNGGISYNLLTDYNGDTLFVDEKGRIVGLDSTGSTADERRIVSSRSSTIDRAITKLKDSASLYCLYDDNEYVYYGTHNYLYVGCVIDSSYEWFKWSIPNVTCMSKHNGVLYYGNKVGEVKQFTPNEYIDINTYRVEDGEITYAINGASSMSGASNFYKLYCLDSYAIQATLLDNGFSVGTSKDNATNLRTIYNNRFGDLQEFLPKFNCNSYAYAYNVKLQLNLSKAYESGRLKVSPAIVGALEGQKVVVGDKTYTFENDTQVTDEKPYLKLIGGEDVTGDFVTYMVCDKVKLTMTGKLYFTLNQFVRVYLIPQTNFKLELVGENNVSSYYLCAPFTADTLTTKKTIWHYSVTQDTYEDNYTSVYRATDINQLDSLIEANNKVANQYSYEDYDYAKMTYERMRTPSSKTMFKPMSCDFICFNFISDTDKNSTLSSVEFRYSYSSSAFGNR